MMKSFKISNILVFIVSALLFGAFLYNFNVSHPVTYNKQNGKSYVKYEKAQVLDVKNNSLKQFNESKNIYFGTQQAKIKILSGEHSGEVKDVTNYLSDTHNVYLKPNMKIVVDIATAGNGSYSVTVYNYYRATVQYIFIFIFLALLCIIGGKKGFKSVLGLIFTLCCIIFLFVPMLYRGYSPVLSAILIVIITTCISLFLLNGKSSKTLSAVLGTISGVIIAGIIEFIFGHFAHLTGLNLTQVESLNMISNVSGMKVYGLLTAAILIASLGAVMDVSISIASSIQEIYMSNPQISKKELFESGMNIGRDMMGTMANTLILAFAGASLSMIIIIYSYNLSYNQLINMDMVSLEIIQGLTGSMAVIFTVPIVSFISAEITTKLHSK
ncbi:YibE/F family protein [Clostridium luticellarii]|uniref:YibE/F-like protein n=1 Tax=Clostridium luticellarii TaxID=1691940 RepID=A0A2T0BPR3_9CLOT|nr:YibE/F family protein [Clostridium luticellarii]MCI1944212.1 YibE/F family protein [Clostridium luticellarii]MCI1967714.1 YibE/F family protein [Clostridium luticellarii]MCI1994837.1 YibE/F family protein [Clostridium luticellarii]MCI2039678.1 YibE/F family protein [Clostridium luticellarii]PRR85825.1 YibE/F-like protein [Clostridium luticellarii]